MDVFFIKSGAGNIFALYHPPENIPLKNNILFIPPFAEELNRSRHMINKQARAFAKAGYGVLIPDLYGTGDSEGAFGGATVEIWQSDILAAKDWLATKGNGAPIIWAMRSGALLAADLVQKNPNLTDHMIFWSPVTNGKRFIAQFLRIKLAADVAGNPSVSQLRAILEEGGNLEIAGYDLSPELATGLSALTCKDMKIPENISVDWIETGMSKPAYLSKASEKIITAWRNEGVKITALAVNDVAFWSLQEPEWANEYCDQTLTLIQK